MKPVFLSQRLHGDPVPSSILYVVYKLGAAVCVVGDSGSIGKPAGARERQGADLCKCKPILPVARALRQVGKPVHLNS